jgi:hypothetical protein
MPSIRYTTKHRPVPSCARPEPMGWVVQVRIFGEWLIDSYAAERWEAERAMYWFMADFEDQGVAGCPYRSQRALQ